MRIRKILILWKCDSSYYKCKIRNALSWKLVFFCFTFLSQSLGFKAHTWTLSCPLSVKRKGGPKQKNKKKVKGSQTKFVILPSPSPQDIMFCLPSIFLSFFLPSLQKQTHLLLSPGHCYGNPVLSNALIGCREFFWIDPWAMCVSFCRKKITCFSMW